MDINIRQATIQDYDGLLALFDQVDQLHRERLPHIFRKPPGPARARPFIQSLLANQAVAIFVAEWQGELVGLVHIIVENASPIPILVRRRYAVVDNLVVRKGEQRAGIGRALMETAHSWAAAQGASAVELNVFSFNEPALAFYRELGYEPLSHKMSRSLE